MRALSGWGRYPVVWAEERLPERLEPSSREPVLARGLGRSYGDASLPAAPGLPVLGTQRADRLLAFDPGTGVLRAEAGLSLLELNRTFLPRGFASPVSPGTQHVTLGGLVASDVHGKNHHVAGCFGAHVRALRMRVPDGRVLEVTRASEPELFRATLGGMGLTGHVLEVELRMEQVPSPWLRTESEPAADLEELVGKLRAASARLPFTVAWFDSARRGRGLGRGVVTAGRWAGAEEAGPGPLRFGARLGVPMELPVSLVRHATIRPFNALYHGLQSRRSGTRLEGPQGFFYPLDAVRHWNRLYGRAGFAQYQCVLPIEKAEDALPRLLETFQRRGGVSAVSVLKDCGPEGEGLLSFPMRGLSLALDVPLAGERTRALVDALNEGVIEAGGRIYLAKDALTRRAHFEAMEPRLDAFRAVRRKWDPERRIRSALAARLIDPPEART